ncbi:hypothetical protein CLAVI_000989 [Candidatus Clavichlamydia salmonicola]|uniref:hypothetical protein n=1 Tax=Candidatus Clavichlamydia salmonicola TaxID=469812 RepID=UPI001890FC9E|nr:hypothetical protein [Candidatus Clavichlamydia salmonicola]MBF5051346.1 hypothetical protein [Candidatus Clavichlamydia salmonicola]
MGISNGVTSGIEYFNRHVLDYTGRRFPSSMSELRANISRNIKTCAKTCTVFMDSSFGLACAMGVVGVAAASICAGDDVVDIITTTMLPATTLAATNASWVNDNSTKEMVFLCFKDTDPPDLKDVSISAFYSYGDSMCSSSPTKVDCGLKLNNTESNFTIFKPEFMDPKSAYLSSYEHYFSSFYDWNKSYPFLRFYQSNSGNMKGFIKSIECLKENTFYVANQTLGKFLTFSDLRQGVCNSNHRGDFLMKENLDAFCFNSSWKMEYYVVHAKNISEEHLLPLSSVLPTTASNFIEADLTDSCDACNVATLVFGVGSAVALFVTTMKVLYQEHKARRVNQSRSSYLGLRPASAAMLNDGLLIAASGLGFGVLMTSLLHSCNPVNDNTKRVVVASTVLYGASAVSKVLAALICKSKDSEEVADESVLIELEEADDGGFDSMGMVSLA